MKSSLARIAAMGFLRGYSAFLDYHYWLNPNPVPLGPTLVSQILTFFAWFVVAGFGIAAFGHATRKKDPLRTDMLGRFSRTLAATGALGLLCLFLAYEQVPVFGMRLWFLLTFAAFIAWLARAVSFLTREYPLRRAAVEERAQLEKYLPKRK